jgi:hypothetical protein
MIKDHYRCKGYVFLFVSPAKYEIISRFGSFSGMDLRRRDII